MDRLYTINDLESTRFGVRVAHIKDSLTDASEVVTQASNGNVNLLIVRLSVNDLNQVHAYQKCGFELMDTLVYYRGNTTSESSHHTQHFIREATHDDASQIESIATAAFTNYWGHYHSDPCIDSDLATDGYADWAKRLTLSQANDHQTFVACQGVHRVGFLSMTNIGRHVAEIVLNAVHPSFQQQGIYHSLLSHATAHAAELGSRQIAISTQLNNYRVQKVWSNQGMWLDSAFYTFHRWLF